MAKVYYSATSQKLKYGFVMEREDMEKLISISKVNYSNVPQLINRAIKEFIAKATTVA